MANKPMTAHVPEELVQTVEGYASRLDRSRNWIVKQALMDWVSQQEERDRLTLEAALDVDAGNYVEHERMRAWADSLGTDKELPPPC